MTRLSQPNLQNVAKSHLRALHVPKDMIKTAISLIPKDIRGLIVYGSRARGDALRTSDLDLLALVDQTSHTRILDNVSLSFYTESQLSSGIGSLFGAHLRRDAKILFDPNGVMNAALTRLTDVNAPVLLKRVHRFSVLFSALDYDLPKYLPSLLRVAKYLLRSALYTEAIAEGKECFSIRELAIRHSDPELIELLASRPSREATKDQLLNCIDRITSITGTLPTNPHGSLEALIINEWDPESELVAMALMALGGTKTTLDYVEVRKVLL